MFSPQPTTSWRQHESGTEWGARCGLAGAELLEGVEEFPMVESGERSQSRYHTVPQQPS